MKGISICAPRRHNNSNLLNIRTAVTTEEIKVHLQQVKYPGFSRDIVSFGLVRSAALVDGVAKVALGLTTSDPKIHSI
jgi:metal-sulfur cluster biosynthetic enzyme